MNSIHLYSQLTSISTLITLIIFFTVTIGPLNKNANRRTVGLMAYVASLTVCSLIWISGFWGDDVAMHQLAVIGMAGQSLMTFIFLGLFSHWRKQSWMLNTTTSAKTTTNQICHID